MWIAVKADCSGIQYGLHCGMRIGGNVDCSSGPSGLCFWRALPSCARKNACSQFGGASLGDRKVAQIWVGKTVHHSALIRAAFHHGSIWEPRPPCGRTGKATIAGGLGNPESALYAGRKLPPRWRAPGRGRCAIESTFAGKSRKNRPKNAGGSSRAVEGNPRAPPLRAWGEKTPQNSTI